MISSHQAIELFQNSIIQWHIDESPVFNPFQPNHIEFLLFQKNQIDTTQWHKEDEIRRMDLSSESFIQLKREIDQLNQQRTDIVEKMDDLFLNYYMDLPKKENAQLNSETPAWMLDRMSILELKIYHMHEEANRKDITETQRTLNRQKLGVLMEQRKDLAQCFDELIKDRMKGIKYFKVYRQMKMYNDPELNPSLYKSRSFKD